MTLGGLKKRVDTGNKEAAWIRARTSGQAREVVEYAKLQELKSLGVIFETRDEEDGDYGDLVRLLVKQHTGEVEAKSFFRCCIGDEHPEKIGLKGSVAGNTNRTR